MYTVPFSLMLIRKAYLHLYVYFSLSYLLAILHQIIVSTFISFKYLGLLTIFFSFCWDNSKAVASLFN